MAWAPIDQQMRDGIEMIKLRRATGLPTATLLGHVSLLWLWALDNAIDGTLPSEPYIVADAMQWPGDPHDLMNMLIASGFVLATNAEGDELEIAHFAARMAQYTERVYDNLQKGRERVQRYRARIREQGETVTGYTKHREAVYARDGHRCVYCLSTENLCLDHLVPIVRGGDHDITNLVTACKRHNSGKQGRLPTEAGYGFAQPHVAELYAASLARASIAAPQAVTVTAVTADTPVTFGHAPHYTTQHHTTVHQTTAEQTTDAEYARARINGGTSPFPNDYEKWRAFCSYAPSDADKAWAKRTTPSVEIEAELENHHEWCELNRATIVEKYDNPTAFWRRWMRRAVEKQQQGGSNGKAGAVGQVEHPDGSDSRDRARGRVAAR